MVPAFFFYSFTAYILSLSIEVYIVHNIIRLHKVVITIHLFTAVTISVNLYFWRLLVYAYKMLNIICLFWNFVEIISIWWSWVSTESVTWKQIVFLIHTKNSTFQKIRISLLLNFVCCCKCDKDYHQYIDAFWCIEQCQIHIMS